jgi:hypothetical protein
LPPPLRFDAPTDGARAFYLWLKAHTAILTSSVSVAPGASLQRDALREALAVSWTGFYGS